MTPFRPALDAPIFRYRRITPLIDAEGVPSGCRVTSAGLVIETGGKIAVPANSVFKGMAMLRVLAGHRRRIRKELARLNETLSGYEKMTT